MANDLYVAVTLSVKAKVVVANQSSLQSFRPVALALALAVVLTFVLQFYTLREGMPYGLTNRLFVVVLLSWLIAPLVACVGHTEITWFSPASADVRIAGLSRPAQTFASMTFSVSFL